MKPVVLTPGRFDIDLQRAILDTSNILFRRAHIPWRDEAVFEKGARDGRSQEYAKVGNETMERIENRHDLCGVPKSMPRDGGPDQRHRLERVSVMGTGRRR